MTNMEMTTIAAPASWRPKDAAPAALQALWQSVTSVEALGVAAIFVELLLACAAAYQAELMTPLFRRVLYFATAGFLAHHLVPRRYRLAAFALFCVGVLVHVLGASPFQFWDGSKGVESFAIVMTIAVALVGICLIPIGFWTRAALLTTVGFVIALFRSGVLKSGAFARVWPVAAALFMFRIIVYFYAVATAKTRPRLTETLAYCFLFPNSAAGLFPVVDFKTFVRSHYNEHAVAIYQRGVLWIARGMTQLLLYRIVRQLFAIKPADIGSGRDVIQYILANSFLYLNVSGQFHFFVGLLLLFGFNLPETHRRFFLASSFTDYWRRVNIYWKDFIQTHCYYPAYFRLKNRGATFALVLATLWSFFVTWALHLYQTWWLTGGAALTWPDILFWSILAVLVLANSMWEMKRGRQRTLAGRPTARAALMLAMRTALTFASVSVLWSLWSSPTLSDWLHMWRFANAETLAWAAAAFVTIMVATILMEVVPAAGKGLPGRASAAPSAAAIGVAFMRVATPLVVIGLVCTPSIQAHLDAAALEPFFDVLNTSEAKAPAQGYYEHLIAADRSSTQLFEPTLQIRKPHVYAGPDPIQPVKDFRFFEFGPNVHLSAYDTDFQTNRWGMRDRDYEQHKPQGTIRIALLGASHAMGWGVPLDQTFKAIVERRLNAEAQAQHDHTRYEILNFAVYNRSPLGSLAALEHQVRAFEPDMVLLVSHPIDVEWTSRDVIRAVRGHMPMPDPFLNSLVNRARITALTPEALATERLQPLMPELLGWTYTRFAAEARRLGIAPAVLFVPIPDDLPLNAATAARQTGILAASGMPLIDLTHLYDHENPKNLMLAETFHHTNERGHALIADALYERLSRDPNLHLTTAPARVARATVPSTQR